MCKISENRKDDGENKCNIQYVQFYIYYFGGSGRTRDSSVGRAVDCSVFRLSIGRWFDSDSRDSFAVHFSKFVRRD